MTDDDGPDTDELYGDDPDLHIDPAAAVPLGLGSAYQSPDGFHRHKCARCGYVWEHEDTANAPPGTNEGTIHLCPKCGKEVESGLFYWKAYDGPEAPAETTRKA